MEPLLRYIRFLIKCSKNHFDFFKAPPIEKARSLAESNLSFWAGIYYLDSKEYVEAAFCFEKAHAHKHHIIALQKQGLYTQAVTLADDTRHYKLGAKLALHQKEELDAAYFLAYYNPSEAAKLYKKHLQHYEAGYCYLEAYDMQHAIKCFNACKNQTERTKGLKQVTEFALTLYFTKHYEEAFNLFIALDDYYSALECARRMKEEPLIASTCLLIGMEEAQKNHYYFAAKCVEPYDKALAKSYYSLAKAPKETVRLMLEDEDYDKALHLCLQTHDLNRAYEIASTYSPELLSS